MWATLKPSGFGNKEGKQEIEPGSLADGAHWLFAPMTQTLHPHVLEHILFFPMLTEPVHQFAR